MIEIRYYLDGAQHAGRRRSFVPRVGDEVRLRTGLYSVVRVVWIEDQQSVIDEGYVAIDIEQIKAAATEQEG